jgi:hypothetical protein
MRKPITIDICGIELEYRQEEMIYFKLTYVMKV